MNYSRIIAGGKRDLWASRSCAAAKWLMLIVVLLHFTSAHVAWGSPGNNVYTTFEATMASVPAAPSAFTRSTLSNAWSELLALASVTEEEIQSATPKQRAVINKKLLSVLPNSDMFVYLLSEEEGAQLGLPFIANAQVGRKKFYIVQEYAIYRSLDAATRNPVDNLAAQGVSVRMIISVNSKDVSVSGLSIGALTLAAESKKLSADISLQVVGINGQAITTATPVPSELNFTTLSAMYRGMDEIKKAIWQSPPGAEIYIRPQAIRKRIVVPIYK